MNMYKMEPRWVSEYGGERLCFNKWTENREIDGVHCHDFVEITYIISGDGSHMIDNATMKVKTGDVFFINPGTYHAFISNGSEPLSVINCMLMPELFELSGIELDAFPMFVADLVCDLVFSEEVSEKPFLYVQDRHCKIKYSYEHALREYIEKDDGYETVILGDVLQILVYFLRAYEKQHNFASHAKAVQTKYIKQVLNYIHEQYCMKISLKDLSNIALLSPNYLSKIFKEMTGETISQYISNIRIEHACEMLRDTKKSVDKIAEETGFGDAGNFRRAFRKQMGISPQVYRSTNKQ